MSLKAKYNVYHNLEGAEARMLLPLKVGQFPVLHHDVAAASETAATALLPTCVGVDEVPSTVRFCLFLQKVILHPIVCSTASVKDQRCWLHVLAYCLRHG
jgi:hypothetical protein